MRGLDRSQAEDLVQDVGERAMRSGVTFHDLEDFLCWAKPVARNLHVDMLRSSKFSVPAAEVPDRESGAPGVEHVVERRLALQTVLHHLGELPAGERDAIVAAASDTPCEPDARPGTVAVRRHRARAHLKRLCGGVLGVGGLTVVARRLRVAGVAAAPVALAALVAVPAVVFGMHVVAGEQAAVVHVAHPSLDDAVAVSVEPAGIVNERAMPAVTAAGSPVTAPLKRGSFGGTVGQTGQHFAASSKVEAQATNHRGVGVRQYEGPEDAPLLCVKVDRVPVQCVDSPYQASTR